MSIIDSSYLIDLMNSDPKAIEISKELDLKGHANLIPSIVVMELWFGAELCKSKKEKEKIHNILDKIEVIDFDLECAKEAARIQVELQNEGCKLPTEDTMIAAIARIGNDKIVTKDGDFARIPDLKVLKY